MNTATTWKTESGSVNISPEREQVLGIEIAGHQALWSPPEVTAAWNRNGERLWIDPEADWHW